MQEAQLMAVATEIRRRSWTFPTRNRAVRNGQQTGPREKVESHKEKVSLQVTARQKTEEEDGQKKVSTESLLGVSLTTSPTSAEACRLAITP